MAYARWEGPVQNEAGDLIEDVWVEVRDENADGNPLATDMFSDRDGAVPLDNPFHVASGQVGFHIVGGCYSIRIYGAGYDQTFRYIGIGTGSERDIAAGSGDVTGPDGSVDETPAVYDGITGKIIKALTWAAFTAKLAVFGADSGGSPGTQGLVPAPAVGDAAAAKVLGVGGWVPQGSLTLNSRSGAYTVVAGDRGKLVEFTGASNVTWGFTAAATLGSGWYCYVVNDSATNYPTLDPNGSEQIDGLTSYPMLPGEMRLVYCTGTGFVSWVLKPFSFKVTATIASLTTPPGYAALDIEGWAGGGSGGSRTTVSNQQFAGGGSGGGHAPLRRIKVALLGSTFSVTIGAGGVAVTGNTAGNDGGDTIFSTGSLTKTVRGGKGGKSDGSNASGAGVPGGGGGWVDEPGFTSSGGSAGTSSGTDGGDGTDGGGGTAGWGSMFSVGSKSGSSPFGGGGGGSTQGSPSSLSAPGTSVFAGNGSAAVNTGSAAPGSIPSGGGGAVRGGGNSGAGARGEMIINGVV